METTITQYGGAEGLRIMLWVATIVWAIYGALLIVLIVYVMRALDQYVAASRFNMRFPRK